MTRKSIATSRAELANLLTKLEGGKSNMNVGDAREFLKKLVHLETIMYVRGYKSVIQVLGKEAKAESKKILKEKSSMRKYKDDVLPSV